MFGKLPKLFERNFAMAFFLPFLVFVGMVTEIASRFDMDGAAGNHAKKRVDDP